MFSSFASSKKFDQEGFLKRIHSELAQFEVDTSALNIELHPETHEIVFYGKLSFRDGTYLNIILDQLNSELDPSQVFTKISRAGLRYIRPVAVRGNDYQLSPNDEELTEYFDSDANLRFKVRHLANLIKKSLHLTVYTGAGISTAAKIPDFRGPDGAWTRRDRGMAGPEGIEMEQAEPTYAHNCLIELHDAKLLKYLVSQNVDGLHRRSGFKKEEISELHGNCYKEICADCKAEIMRTFDVGNHRGKYFKGVRDTLSQSGISHITGRKCDECGKGMLRDSIIHFGENLPEYDLNRAIEESKITDLAFCVGTSLRVTPACDLPETNPKVRLVILNLQQTPKDEKALRSGGFLIHHKIDKVFEYLMEELQMDFPRMGKDSNEERFEKDFSRNLMIKKKKTEEKFDQAAMIDQQLKERHAKASVKGNVLPAEFFYGNTHQLVNSSADENSNNWTFFISAEKDSTTPCNQFIKRVVVQLHPTFTPSTLEFVLEKSKDESKEQLDNKQLVEISRLGWGTFDIKAKIEFLDEFNRDPVEITHSLNFSNDRTVNSFKIPPKSANLGLLSALKNNMASLKPTTTTVRTESGRIYTEDKESREAELKAAENRAKGGIFHIEVAHDEQGNSVVRIV